MALIDIEYGSLASSETMNKNFMYLDEKIADTSESIMTSISSILSNIATINNRLNDISENMTDSIQSMSTKLEDYKAKTKMLVNKSSLTPDWINCVEISLSVDKKYTVNTVGYILMLPKNSSVNTFAINDNVINFKQNANSYGHIMFIPVFEGDVLSTEANIDKLYFLPSREVTIEDF